jgi:hypothetical protein
LYDKYRGLGLELVAIQVHPEQNDLVPAWRTNGKYTFPVVFVPPAATGNSGDFARARFDVVGTPTNLLLNSDRKIVFRHPGGVGDALESELRELLGLMPAVR